MKFNLIICTYERAQALQRLLESVKIQSLYPNEILVVDGSRDDLTADFLKNVEIQELKYYKVDQQDRGLTRQRNYGIRKTGKEIEIVCFLDDDIILEPEYFEKLMETYKIHPDAIGVGGFISNDVAWEKDNTAPGFDEFKMDGYIRKLGERNVLRKKLGLLSNLPPGVMPEFSNGLSPSFFPPSGKVYLTEFFMGGVSSYRKNLFDKIEFSKYFEGYGLYEDMDFCLRATQYGRLYLNTAARVEHFHEQSGRPDKFKYGKMVIRNGWYVWRIKNPNPGLKAKFKWHTIAFLLILVRLGNVITSPKRTEAFDESLGRIMGWCSLIFNKPQDSEKKA